MNNQQLETIARFWQHVEMDTHSASQKCWIWTGAQNGRGYGVASVGAGETMLAHRAVAHFRGDTLTKDTVVMHRCDNPLCVRPDHLITSDQTNNMLDMNQKGRNSRAKLTPEIVRDIRTRRISRKEFAQQYSISEYTVGDVQRGTTWGWLP